MIAEAKDKGCLLQYVEQWVRNLMSLDTQDSPYRSKAMRRAIARDRRYDQAIARDYTYDQKADWVPYHGCDKGYEGYEG